MSNAIEAEGGRGPAELLRLRRQRRLAEWVAAFLLGVIATAGLFLAFDSPASSGVALGQMQAGYGARGVYALAGQVTRQSYGLWMLDVDAGNLWCYELQQTEDLPRLRLLAARSWIHDRYLPEFNLAGLTPADVAKLVDELDRAARQPDSKDVGDVGTTGGRSQPETDPGQDIRADSP